MGGKSLTKAVVEALAYDFSKWTDRKKPAPRQIEWDGKVRGFGCRTTPEGGKQYVLSYRFNGRPKLMSLGRIDHFRGPDEAREKASALLHDLRHKGIDPMAARDRLSSAETVAALWEVYTTEHLAGLSDNVRANLLGRNPEGKPGGWWANHIQPEIGHLKPLQVAGGDMIRLHDKVTKKAANPATGDTGKTTANRVIQRLRHFFDWSHDRDEHLFPPEWKNPTLKVKLHKEEPRSHFLNVAQMRLLFSALDADPDPYFRGFIGLLLFTAARKNEILKLKWSDVDLPGRVAHVKRTKNGSPLAMPLPEPAIRLFESLPRVANTEWVFPSGRKPSVSMHEPRAAYKKLLKTLKLPVETTFHDLRRSVGCSLAAAGYTEVQISAILNNTANVAARHYIKLASDAKRQIADAHASILLPVPQS